MKRRDLITIIGGVAAVWPGIAFAQTFEGMRRIGVLSSVAPDPQALGWIETFRQRLKVLGWTEGRNLHIDTRWGAGNAATMRTYATELVAAKPEAILGVGNAIAALKPATTSVPIVFVMVPDPVGQGLVTNLAHPGGNITGFTTYEAGMGGKWLEFLKEIAPRVTRAAILLNPDLANNVYTRQIEAAAPSFGMKAIVSSVRSDPDIEDVLRGLGGEAGGGMIVPADAFTITHHQKIIASANQYRVPTVYPYPDLAAEGGLIAYGIDRDDVFRQAALYIDRILRGEKPANLPVQGPTKFELSINLKTARALGLTIPPTLLVEATEVIQ